MWSALAAMSEVGTLEDGRTPGLAQVQEQTTPKTTAVQDGVPAIEHAAPLHGAGQAKMTHGPCPSRGDMLQRTRR